MPHALACLGVQGAEGLGEAFHFRPSGSVFVGARSYLAHQACIGSIGRYVQFRNKAQGTDDDEGIMLHGHGGVHGVERTFVEEVHEHGGKEVVLMMPQGYLVETVLYGKVEHSLTAIACTKEAAGLALVGAFVKGGVEDVQGDAKSIAELLHVGNIRLVGHIVHNHMHGLYPYGWFEDTGTLCHQLGHDKGVLASGEGEEYPVAVGEKGVGGTGFVEETGEDPLNPPIGGRS